MVSEETAFEYSFALMLLAQELPFGLTPKWSEAAAPYANTPITELTDEQAKILTADMKAQRQRFFEEEGKRLSEEESARWRELMKGEDRKATDNGNESN